jgi:hypothetical protein
MAKKKSAGAEVPTKIVKFDRALSARAQMIATDTGVPLEDYSPRHCAERSRRTRAGW